METCLSGKVKGEGLEPSLLHSPVTQEPKTIIGICCSCGQSIYNDEILYVDPQCKKTLHGGEPGSGCGSWVGEEKPQRVCEYCAGEAEIK